MLAASLLKNAESVLAQYFDDELVGGGSATSSVFRRREQVLARSFASTTAPCWPMRTSTGGHGRHR